MSSSSNAGVQYSTSVTGSSDHYTPSPLTVVGHLDSEQLGSEAIYPIMLASSEYRDAEEHVVPSTSETDVGVVAQSVESSVQGGVEPLQASSHTAVATQDMGTQAEEPELGTEHDRQQCRDTGAHVLPSTGNISISLVTQSIESAVQTAVEHVEASSQTVVATHDMSTQAEEPELATGHNRQASTEDAQLYISNREGTEFPTGTPVITWPNGIKTFAPFNVTPDGEYSVSHVSITVAVVSR